MLHAQHFLLVEGYGLGGADCVFDLSSISLSYAVGKGEEKERKKEWGIIP